MGKKYLIHLFFILLFLGLFLWSSFSMVRKFVFIKNASRAIGVVVDINEETGIDDPKDSSYYVAVIQFTANNGSKIKFSPISTRGKNNFTKPYTLGAEYEVLYDSNYPENAVINKFSEIWLINIIFVLCSGLFLAKALFSSAEVETKFISNEDFLKYAYMMNKKGSSLKVEFYGENAGVASLKFRSQLFGSKDIKVIIFTTEFSTLPEEIKLKIQNQIEPWVSKA